MVHTDELAVRVRAAAILVIVFGQHIEDVIQLTRDDVTVTDDVVTIRVLVVADVWPQRRGASPRPAHSHRSLTITTGR